ncbi:MAG: hypothetical protein SGPRY_008281, partial [Prymnesium sp.]
AELAISDPFQAEALSTRRPLMSLLFRLMGDKHTVDAALTLAQELLAVGRDIFPLSSVPNLPQLLVSLSPRSLALVGRALAVLLAKAAERSTDGVPAPECVAPDLCASCANNQMLLAIPSLLSRIIALLRLKAPPPGLWGHMLAQLPNSQGLMQQWHDEREQDWAQLGESLTPSPHVLVLLSPEQIPPGLRELVSTNPAMVLPGAHTTPIPTLLQAEGGAHETLHLSSLQAALWSTLQADLLYVLWALMGGKTKAEAQERLVRLGLLDVLQSMFDRLDWRPPPVAHHVQHGAGCTCSPQSCLQMQLLRTLQVLCEKESDQLSYHRLLLQPLPATDAQRDSADDRIPSHCESSSLPDKGTDGLLHAIMRLLLQQPSDSVFLLGLASCVHKWVQASSAAEQQLVAGFPGFIDFVLDQLLCEPTPPDPQLQVFFDLLAEVIKFNPPLLVIVQQTLCSGPDGAARARAFTERLSSNIVDASIFVQCVALTLNSSTSPRRGRKALADLGIDDDPRCISSGLDVLDVSMADLPAGHEHKARGGSASMQSELSSGPASRLNEQQIDSDGALSSPSSSLAAASSTVVAEQIEEGQHNDECLVIASAPMSAAFAHVGAKTSADEVSSNSQSADFTCPHEGSHALDPSIHAMLTTPLPLPPPAPADTMEVAEKGQIARYILENEVELTLRLMGTVQVSEVSVETMCVINAAIVFFLIAERRGERQRLINKVLEAVAASDSSLALISAFLKLLSFWGDVYHSHSCERRFLEFSSGIPFEHWLSLVESLKNDFQHALKA